MAEKLISEILPADALLDSPDYLEPFGTGKLIPAGQSLWLMGGTLYYDGHRYCIVKTGTYQTATAELED